MGQAQPQKSHRAFTLIEIIGVITVIAILVSVLLPTIFGAIRSAAVNQTAASINSVRTACAGHSVLAGGLASDGSVNPPAAIPLDGSDPRALQFDKVLIWESMLDAAFAPKIGDAVLGPTNTRIQVVAAASSTTPVTQDNSAYNLDGIGVNEASGVAVIEAVITGVSLEDAKALNDVLDGSALGQDASGNDFVGRVKYAAPGSVSGAGSGSGASGGSTGNGGGAANGNGSAHGNGNGLGNGGGNGGQNNGNGNGGSDHGNGTGNSGTGNGNSGGGTGQGSGSSGASTGSPNTVTVHVYITHR